MGAGVVIGLPPEHFNLQAPFGPQPVALQASPGGGKPETQGTLQGSNDILPADERGDRQETLEVGDLLADQLRRAQEDRQGGPEVKAPGARKQPQGGPMGDRVEDFLIERIADLTSARRVPDRQRHPFADHRHMSRLEQGIGRRFQRREIGRHFFR